ARVIGRHALALGRQVDAELLVAVDAVAADQCAGGDDRRAAALHRPLHEHAVAVVVGDDIAGLGDAGTDAVAGGVINGDAVAAVAQARVGARVERGVRYPGIGDGGDANTVALDDIVGRRDALGHRAAENGDAVGSVGGNHVAHGQEGIPRAADGDVAALDVDAAAGVAQRQGTGDVGADVIVH